MSLVTPTRSQTHTFKEQQSKLISILFPYEDVSAFKSWLSDLRKEYHDASHICWAYRIYTGNQLEENSSDAGEPSGTAGLPILNAMKQKNLVNCGVAVIRYFGGTKLGKRGLIDAYSQAAQRVIDRTSLISWVKKDHYVLTSPMIYYGNLSKSLVKMGGKILEDRSSESLKWDIEINTDCLNELIKSIRTVTQGEGDLERIKKGADAAKPRRV